MDYLRSIRNGALVKELSGDVMLRLISMKTSICINLYYCPSKWIDITKRKNITYIAHMMCIVLLLQQHL